jgi:hypothetical protein
MRIDRRVTLALLLVLASCTAQVAAPRSETPTMSPAGHEGCGAYAAPDPSVSAEIQHLKTSATVVEALGPCTLRVRIAGGAGTLVPFTGKVIVLRATSQTTFASADKGDLTAIGRFGLGPNDSFTLSFDSRAFNDGSYPLNFMNR